MVQLMNALGGRYIVEREGSLSLIVIRATKKVCLVVVILADQGTTTTCINFFSSQSQAGRQTYKISFGSHFKSLPETVVRRSKSHFHFETEALLLSASWISY